MRWTRKTSRRPRTLSATDVATTVQQMQQAISLFKEKRYAAAEVVYLKVLQTCQASFGEGNRSTLTVMSNLALCLRAQKRFAEADVLHYKVGERE